MSTAAMAVIELGIDYWEDVAAGTGKLLEVVRPKDRLKTIGKLS
jgi:hypothetical protein